MSRVRSLIQTWKGWRYSEIGGFKIAPEAELATTLTQIEEYYKSYEKRREELDYEIDGVVVKTNQLYAREELGNTSHHPRWALALKFEPRKAVTRIRKIVVQVGRTGKPHSSGRFSIQ